MRNTLHRAFLYHLATHRTLRLQLELTSSHAEITLTVICDLILSAMMIQMDQDSKDFRVNVIA